MAYKKPVIETLKFGLAGVANATPGLLTRGSSVSKGNPGGIHETTSAGNPDFNNGGADPYIAINDCSIIRGALELADCAVSQATTGANMTARFDVYTIGYSSRTLLGSMDFSITDAGTNQNLTGSFFQIATLENVGLNLSAGDLFGVQFTNRNADNNEITAVSGCFLTLDIEDR